MLPLRGKNIINKPTVHVCIFLLLKVSKGISQVVWGESTTIETEHTCTVSIKTPHQKGRYGVIMAYTLAPLPPPPKSSSTPHLHVHVCIPPTIPFLMEDS